MNIPNLKRLGTKAFHMVKVGNYFVHIAETSRVLQKIGETHIKVVKGKDMGCTFLYYGGYMGTEYSEA